MDSRKEISLILTAQLFLGHPLHFMDEQERDFIAYIYLCGDV